MPILTISRQPSGGGTSYEGLNLLQPKFEGDFLVDADHKDAKVFQLSFGGLDEAAVTVQVMTADSDWADKTEGTDFTVDRETGAVTFTTAPGATPVSGTDNVKITASRTVTGYADRVNRCVLAYSLAWQVRRIACFGPGTPSSSTTTGTAARTTRPTGAIRPTVCWGRVMPPSWGTVW